MFSVAEHVDSVPANTAGDKKRSKLCEKMEEEEIKCFLSKENVFFG
jgi:hypothetical protein